MPIEINETIEPKVLQRRMRIAAERTLRYELWQSSASAERIDQLCHKVVEATGPAGAELVAPPFASRPRWQRKLLRLYCKVVLKATRFITIEQRKQNVLVMSMLREMVDLIKIQQMDLLRLQEATRRQDAEIERLRDELAHRDSPSALDRAA